MIIDNIFSSFNAAKWNLGQVNHEPMRPAGQFPAEQDIFAGPPPSFDGTSSQAHQFAMSLISGISTGRILSFQYNSDK